MSADFIDLVNSQKTYKCDFVLNPHRIHSFTSKFVLSWKKVKFDQKNKRSIPKTRGIYAFVISGENESLPPHGYVLYIGQVGNENPSRTLRARFGEYNNELKVRKRPGVYYFLNQWNSCLFFYFVEIPDSGTNLKEIESMLNDALFPPFSDNDLSADLRQAKRAF